MKTKHAEYSAGPLKFSENLRRFKKMLQISKIQDNLSSQHTFPSCVKVHTTGWLFSVSLIIHSEHMLPVMFQKQQKE